MTAAQSILCSWTSSVVLLWQHSVLRIEIVPTQIHLRRLTAAARCCTVPFKPFLAGAGKALLSHWRTAVVDCPSHGVAGVDSAGRVQPLRPCKHKQNQKDHGLQGEPAACAQHMPGSHCTCSRHAASCWQCCRRAECSHGVPHTFCACSLLHNWMQAATLVFGVQKHGCQGIAQPTSMHATINMPAGASALISRQYCCHISLLHT
jgi:hypothetical protein